MVIRANHSKTLSKGDFGDFELEEIFACDLTGSFLATLRLKALGSIYKGRLYYRVTHNSESVVDEKAGDHHPYQIADKHPRKIRPVGLQYSLTRKGNLERVEYCRAYQHESY
jgi:hypothetical protein